MKQQDSIQKEISLSEFIQLILDWKNYLFGHWKIWVLAGLIGGLGGVLIAWIKKPSYLAQLTFALEEKSSGGSLGVYAGIASQFGLDLGGGGGGAFAGDNIIHLMLSKRLLESTLLSPATIDGKDELLINRYIKFNGLDKSWQRDGEALIPDFKKDLRREQLTYVQDSILAQIAEEISKNSISVERMDKKLSIIKVSFVSKDEEFAHAFVTTLLDQVTDFYIHTKTGKAKKNIDLLENRVDSVRTELDRELFALAGYKDENLNLVRAQGNVTTAKRQMNIQLLTTLYGELVKNLELAKLALSREEPLVQPIDVPRMPLTEIKLGKPKAMIIGGVVAGFLALCYLIVGRILTQVLKEDKFKKPALGN